MFPTLENVIITTEVLGCFRDGEARGEDVVGVRS